MLASLVFGLIMLQAVDDPNPTELVQRLGAAGYADRAAAGEALVKLGRAAAPALLKAKESRDPEVRLRAEILLARIEAHEVLQPTQIRLDVRDRPLAEVVAALETASGMRIRPGAAERSSAGAPTWPERRATLKAAEPISFWEAIDRLCQAGGLQREYPPAENKYFAFSTPAEFTLVPGRARPPASDAGPLRVELLRVRYRRDCDYGNRVPEFPLSPAAAGRKRDAATGALEQASYQAELLVSVEPRLRIFGVGAVEEPEAVDDQGRSLLKRLTAEEEMQQQAHRRMNPHLDPRLHPALRYNAGSRRSTGVWTVSIPLSYPSPPASRIAALRGVIPMAVLARRPDPLVVALKDAAGREFSAGSTKITVHEIKTEAGRDPIVDLTLEAAERDDRETIMACDSKGTRLALRSPLDLMKLRFDVVDARGENLDWQFTRPPIQRTWGRMAIVIRGRNSKRVRPDELRLRYWGVAGAAVDLPFAFQDVPTP